MFKKFEEIMVKEGIMTMPHQTKIINRDRNYKNEPNESCKD